MSILADKLLAQIKTLTEEIRHQKKTNDRLRQTIESMRHRRSVKAIQPATIRHAAGDIVRVIVTDTHGSSIDTQAAAAFLGDLRELDPDEIIMLGDHVDCGGFLAQHHTMGFVAETEYSYEEDIEHAAKFLDSIQELAGKATIEQLEGNHEVRIERWAVTETLRHRKDAEALRRLYAPNFRLKLKERGIPFYREAEKYDGLALPGIIRRGKCFFTHGAFALGKHAASKVLARIGGNTWFGNTHRADSFTTDLVQTGTVGAWNPGCLCRKQPLWQHTNPTAWTHGYGLQLVDRKTGNFLSLNIPIVNGVSLLKPLLKHGSKK